jgi:hypothetical protein
MIMGHISHDPAMHELLLTAYRRAKPKSKLKRDQDWIELRMGAGAGLAGCERMYGKRATRTEFWYQKRT